VLLSVKASRRRELSWNAQESGPTRRLSIHPSELLTSILNISKEDAEACGCVHLKMALTKASSRNEYGRCILQASE
jgi:hypothetical protein